VGKCRYSSRSRPPYGKRGLISLALLGATPSTTSPFRGERTSCDRRKFLVAVAGIHPIQTEGMCPSLRPYLSQRHGEGRFRLPEALALGLPGGQPFTSTSIRHGKVSIHGVKGGRSGSDSGFNLHGSFNKRGAKGSFNRNSMSVSSKILATPFFVRPPVVLSMVGGRVWQFASFLPFRWGLELFLPESYFRAAPGRICPLARSCWQQWSVRRI
jgi:hypothetical protein